MDSPPDSLSTVDSNATSTNAQESLSSQKPPLYAQSDRHTFEQMATRYSEPSDHVDPPAGFVDTLGTDSGAVAAGYFGLNPDSPVFLQSPESTSYVRSSDETSFRNPESPSLHEKSPHDEKCKNTRSLSVRFGPVDRRNMDKVRFSEDGNESEDDYSASVSAIILRRTSSKRRSRSSFSPEELSNTSRRRSSAFTTSSGDTGISMEELEAGGGTDEQVVENIRLHKEVLTNVKQQPWSMRRKLKLVQQAKSYIKRHEGELQERLAQSRSTKDFLARFNILLVKEWQHTKREVANVMNFLIPWELRIKEIESHFGSAVASYFTFLRWLFFINFMLALVLILFVAIPELLSDPPDCGERKHPLPEEEADARKLSTLFEFEGILKYSPIFYGYYSNTVRSRYKTPLAFFIVTLVLYIYSFVAILKRMASNSKMSKLADKDDECVFTWKLFTGWDYMIGNAETAQNRTSSIILGFKEALVEEAEKQRDHLSWKIICVRIIVNILVVFLLGVSAITIIKVVSRSQEPEAHHTIWRKNEAVVVIWVIGVTFPRLLEKLGNFEQLHPRKNLRMLLARIMVLQIVNLYTFFLEHLVETGKTINELQHLKEKLHGSSRSNSSSPSYSSFSPLPNVTECSFKIVQCSFVTYLLSTNSSTVTYLPTTVSSPENITRSGIHTEVVVGTITHTRSTAITSPIPTFANTIISNYTTTNSYANVTSPHVTNLPISQGNDTITNGNLNTKLEQEVQVTTEETKHGDSFVTNSSEEPNGITRMFENVTDIFTIQDNQTEYKELLELSTTQENIVDVTSDEKSGIIKNNESEYDSGYNKTYEPKENATDGLNETGTNGTSQNTTDGLEESTTDDEEGEIDGAEENESDQTEDKSNSINISLSLENHVNPANSVNDFESIIHNYDYALELSNETVGRDFDATLSLQSVEQSKENLSRSKRKSIEDNVEKPATNTSLVEEVNLETNEIEFIDNVTAITETLDVIQNGSIYDNEISETMIINEFPSLDSDLNEEHASTTFSDYFLDNFTDSTVDLIEGENPRTNLTPPPILSEIEETTVSIHRGEDSLSTNISLNETEASTPSINLNEENTHANSSGVNPTNHPESNSTYVPPESVSSVTTMSSIGNPNVNANGSRIDSESSTPETSTVNHQEKIEIVPEIQTPSHLVSPTPIESDNQGTDTPAKMCMVYECLTKPFNDEELSEENQGLVTSTIQTLIPNKIQSFCTNGFDFGTRKKLRNLCWETKIGQELVKLTVVDLVSTIGLTILADAGRALFVRYMNPCWCWDLEKTFPKYADFNIAENILGLVYNQGYVWIGMFFAPGLPLINLIKLMVLMYLNSWAVLTSNVPHEVVFRASRSNNFYLALLLLQLFLAVLPVGYTIVAIEPSWHCGPFSGDDRIYNIFTRSIKDWLPKSSHRALDYLASPGTIIPLLILLILIIYYLASLTSALKEANIDLKIQLRRERTEERRKMYQLVAKKKTTGVELLDSTLSKWREIIPDTPVEKTAGDTEKPTKEDLMMKFIHKTRRKTSDTGCEKSDEDREYATSAERKNVENGNTQADKKVYQKRKSSSSIWSSDNIPEIKISESNNSDPEDSETHEYHRESTGKAPFQTGSTDTVIEINEPRKLDSPDKFKIQRKPHNNGACKNTDALDNDTEQVKRREKEDGNINGEKRHKKRKKLELQNNNVEEDTESPREDVRRHLHSTGDAHKKHRVKKLSKENLDKLQVQIEQEEEGRQKKRRKPRESSSDVDEVDEKIRQDRNKRKIHKEVRLVPGASSLEKANSLEIEMYRNLSREFISPKRKQLLKQLKYKNRRYQIYCDDVTISRSLEHDYDQLRAAQQDENKSKSLNHLLENR